MISMLLKGKAETIPTNKTIYHIENRPSEELSSDPSPRVLCSHMRMSDSPEELTKGNCKVNYQLRDPKDVAVSLFNLYRDLPYCHYKGEFKDFLYLFLEGKGE